MKKFIVTIILILFIGISFPQINPGFNTGNIGVEMNYYGRIRLYQPNLNDTTNLWSLSILVGTSPSTVFDYWQDSGTQDSTISFYDSLNFNWGLYGSFNNSFSNLPPNVLIKTYVTGWTGDPFVLLKYVIINKESFNINALIGLDIIPMMDGNFGFDTVKYVDTSNVIDIYKQNHLGFKLLSGSLKSLTSFEYFDGYENDSSYYNWMTHDTLDSFYNSGAEGPVTITSQDFQNINSGDSVTVYYGMAFGESFASVKTGLDSVSARYINLITGIVKNNEVNLPRNYMLNQNYPNPFNPSTTISFSIPVQENVSIKVYNILGKEVATLINEVKTAGSYSVRFDAGKLSSGIYFYKLETPGYRNVRKMILLK
jgi:hypothetical protein